MAERDGGPAFPQIGYSRLGDGTRIEHVGGMSLRDYMEICFVAAMLQGTLGRFTEGTAEVSAYHKGKCNEAIVDRAKTLASLMLEKRDG